MDENVVQKEHSLKKKKVVFKRLDKDEPHQTKTITTTTHIHTHNC